MFGLPHVRGRCHRGRCHRGRCQRSVALAGGRTAQRSVSEVGGTCRRPRPQRVAQLGSDPTSPVRAEERHARWYKTRPSCDSRRIGTPRNSRRRQRDRDPAGDAHVSRTLKYAKRAMRFRCPNCGVGKVRRGWGSVHERCSHCNFKFARSGAGYLTGAMFCNFPIAGFLFASCCNGGRGDVASCALGRGDVYRRGRRGARANAVVSVFATDVADG